MKSKPLVLMLLLLVGGAVLATAERPGIGLFVWSPKGVDAIAEKTRMRLIVDNGTPGGPVDVLRDFAKGTSTQSIVDKLVEILKNEGLSVTRRTTAEGRVLLTVHGAKALRISYAPSTVLTELTEAPGIEELPALVARD